MWMKTLGWKLQIILPMHVRESKDLLTTDEDFVLTLSYESLDAGTSASLDLLSAFSHSFNCS